MYFSTFRYIGRSGQRFESLLAGTEITVLETRCPLSLGHQKPKNSPRDTEGANHYGCSRPSSHQTHKHPESTRRAKSFKTAEIPSGRDRRVVRFSSLRADNYFGGKQKAP